MYQLLLCWRYLRTRLIAMVSIVSVMLGVATMIVVNAVMSGFTTEMQKRIHGILSDVVLEARSLNGFPNPEWHMERIRAVAGDDVAGMTPTVVVPAMLSFQIGDEWITRQVQLIGVDPFTHAQVSDFAKYLQHPLHRSGAIDFLLKEGGYDTYDHQSLHGGPERRAMAIAGWEYRRRQAAFRRIRRQVEEQSRWPRYLQTSEGNVAPAANPFVNHVNTVGSAGLAFPQDNTPSSAFLREPREIEYSPGGLVNPLRVNASGAEELNRGAGESSRSQSSEFSPTEQPTLPGHRVALKEHLPAEISRGNAQEAIPPGLTSAPWHLPPADPFVPPAAPEDMAYVDDPFRVYASEREESFDMASQQHTGAVLGIALACDRYVDATGKCHDRFFLLPGDDVILSFPNAADPSKGGRLTVIHDTFTIVDFYESKMAEYDASFVFVPLAALQEKRGMFDRATGVRYVNAIQIKLRPGADGSAVRDKLQAVFPPELYVVSTWRDKQSALLAAVRMEIAILNVLLFLIIAVAGFGILAIFLMIVVEKTRDIGILKSLGASSFGVQAIFLGYGLGLGVVGSGVGLVLGLIFVRYINEIASFLGELTGRPLFDPEIYYFYRIPTIVEPATVAWIVGGAIGIAVLASIVPALRAARLHPVQALRYE